MGKIFGHKSTILQKVPWLTKDDVSAVITKVEPSYEDRLRYRVFFEVVDRSGKLVYKDYELTKNLDDVTSVVQNRLCYLIEAHNKQQKEMLDMRAFVGTEVRCSSD